MTHQTQNSLELSIALIGECMVELQEIASGRINQTFGGDTLNTAIYMARLAQVFPARIDYVTALGRDSFSDAMIAFWEKEGVGSSLVQRKQGEMPGLYYIQLDEQGERQFSYWRGEAAAKKCFEYDKSSEILEKLQDYDCIYLSGISIAILTDASRERLFRKLSEAAENTTRIALDYNYRPHLWTKKHTISNIYNDFISISDTVFVGRDELSEIHGIASVSNGHSYLAEKGVKESIIRNGSDPCSVFSNGKEITIPAEQGVEVVDTTAAGDSFSAAYLLARNSGHTPMGAARIAHRLAAHVIGFKGAVIPLETMEDPSLFIEGVDS